MLKSTNVEGVIPAQPVRFDDCCDNHTGPHDHGCVISGDHRGECVLPGYVEAIRPKFVDVRIVRGAAPTIALLERDGAIAIHMPASEITERAAAALADCLTERFWLRSTQ